VTVDGSALGGDTVTIHRAGSTDATDDYGNPVPADDVTHDVEGCNLQPLIGSIAENNAPDSVTISVGYRLFAPYGSDIRDTDWLVLAGTKFDIEGGVMAFAPSDGFDGHLEMYLHRHGG